MKSDGGFVFDFLKADFSVLNGRSICYAEIQPEYHFYFKHRMIHLLNQINEVQNVKVTFDSFRVLRYMITANKTVVITMGTDSDGMTLRIYYDSNNEPSRYEISAREHYYNNKTLFKKTDTTKFSLSIDVDKNFNIIQHMITRKINSSFHDEDSFCMIYKFLDFNLYSKTITYEGLDTYGSYDQHMNLMFYNLNPDFEDVFSWIIEPVFKHQKTFLALYSEYSMTHILREDEFKVFINESQELFNNGTFSSTLEDNLVVMSMIHV